MKAKWLIKIMHCVVSLVLFSTSNVPSQAALSDIELLANSDEFSSPSLAASWSWGNEDSTHWSLTQRPGYLRIITQHGDIMQSPNDARNILLQAAPTGDFEIVTKVDFNPTESYQQAGLIVHQDNDNYIKIVRIFSNGGTYVATAKEINQSFSHMYSPPVPLALTTTYLKITKQGTTYTCLYSSNGLDWIQVEQYPQVDLRSIKVGLMAVNAWPYPSEIPADFDYFRVRTRREFAPNPDGYNFPNSSRSVPSWDTFKSTFSNSSLEDPSGNPKYLAGGFYNEIYSTAWAHGVCFGMSSSALAYYQTAEVQPGGATSTFGLDPSQAWPPIELYNGRQLSKGIQNYVRSWNELGVDAFYELMKSRIPNSASDPSLIIVKPGAYNSLPKEQRFQHMLVPYRVEESPGSWGKIYVYDPNHPGSNNRFIYFDFLSVPHSFDYDMGASIGGSIGNFHVRSIDRWTLVMLPFSQLGAYDAKVVDYWGYLTWIFGSNEVVFTNSLGQSLGYVNGVYTSTISGSTGMFPWITLPYTPSGMGVSLPVATYTAIITSNGLYKYSASSSTNVASLKTYATTAAATDFLVQTIVLDYVSTGPSGGLSYSTTFGTGRSIDISIAGGDPFDDRRYDLAGVQLTGLPTLQVQMKPAGLLVETNNISSTFDLDIRGLEGTGSVWFLHRDIPVPLNASLSLDVPQLTASSVVTVSVSFDGGPIEQTWIIENQIQRVFLPLNRR